jgi:hypothetical protein
MVMAINPHSNLIHLLLIKKRSQYEIRSIMIWAFENKYYFHQMEDYLLSNRVSHTYLSQDCMSENKDLNNYNGLIDPREHIQNTWSNLEPVIQDSGAMYKMLLTMFCGSTWA